MFTDRQWEHYTNRTILMSELLSTFDDLLQKFDLSEVKKIQNLIMC